MAFNLKDIENQGALNSGILKKHKNSFIIERKGKRGTR